jgi:hypothetical protein
VSTAWTQATVDPDVPEPDDVKSRARDLTYDTTECVDQPRLQVIADFAAFWRSKASAGRLPARADFAIEELHRWFGHVLIMDVGADARDFRYRMIGTEITAFRDRDYTGKWLSECAYGETRESMISTFRNPVIHRRPMFRRGWVQWPVDGTWRSFDSVHCPLADNGEDPDMTIGVLYFDAFPALGADT